MRTISIEGRVSTGGLKRVALIGAFLVFAGGRLAASTYYVATNGNDTGLGTSAQPWATFAHAFDQMAGGDTLIIKDGTYTQPIRAYYSQGLKSGSAGNYTVVKAEHDFRVLIDGAGFVDSGTGNGPLSIDGRSYVEVRGIKFKSNPNGTLEPGGVTGDHIKIIRCAFFDAPGTGNYHAFSIGEGSQYILVEDCHAWGTGRYKFQALLSDKVIYRRCVARYDRHTSPSYARPQACFTIYQTSNGLIENCIAIDSDQEQYNVVEGVSDDKPFRGGFYFPNGLSSGGKVMGSIGLKLRGYAGVINEQSVGSQEVSHTVIWDSKGGINYADLGEPSNVLINHVTVGDISGTPSDGWYAWGGGVYATSGFSGARTTNSLLTQTNSYGIADWMQSDYNDFYDNPQNYMNIRYDAPTPAPGPHDRYVNPNLMYLPRTETGSPLERAASDGGNIGASIMFRSGVSGTLWGEPGYDSLTNEPLWPFPNEDEIKNDMSSYVGPPNGKRGFCADGTGLYGGPITLTSFIWEYLGHPCPADICGPVTPPARLSIGDTSVAEGTGGSKTVTLRVTLSAPSTDPVTVDFATGESATPTASDAAAGATPR